MNPPFFIIDGGLKTAPVQHCSLLDDKVVHFESPPDDDRAPAMHEPGFLRALDDNNGFDDSNAETAGCILDFEYNGVPARNGFLLD